jgi:hypothetical protein
LIRFDLIRFHLFVFFVSRMDTALENAERAVEAAEKMKPGPHRVRLISMAARLLVLLATTTAVSPLSSPKRKAPRTPAPVPSTSAAHKPSYAAVVGTSLAHADTPVSNNDGWSEQRRRAGPSAGTSRPTTTRAIIRAADLQKAANVLTAAKVPLVNGRQARSGAAVVQLPDDALVKLRDNGVAFTTAGTAYLFANATADEIAKAARARVGRVCSVVTTAKGVIAHLPLAAKSVSLNVGMLAFKLGRKLPTRRRCFNCQEIGHNAAGCTNTKICAVCADVVGDSEHVCSNARRCGTCIAAGDNGDGHAAMEAMKCPKQA